MTSGKGPLCGVNLCDVLNMSVVNYRGMLHHGCWQSWPYETMVWSILLLGNRSVNIWMIHQLQVNSKSLMSVDVSLDNGNFYTGSGSTEGPVLAQIRSLGEVSFTLWYHWCRYKTACRVDDIYSWFSFFNLDSFDFHLISFEDVWL